MNDHKIAFIICTNNDMLLNECLLYLSKLNVPEGYEADVLTITDAKCMTAAYNDIISECDAKYKVFMHQDLFIINPNFISDFLSIFQADSGIGMIGLVGYPTLSDIGIMWEEARVGSVPLYGVGRIYGKMDFSNYKYDLANDTNYVSIIDGLCMITQYDVPWDPEFDGWDFYDASHSMDMLMAGYKIAVPKQRLPWFIHDDGGVLALCNYNKYRVKFINKYKKYLGKNWYDIINKS